MASRKPKTKKLYRSQDNSVIAGVAGGLGDFFIIDPLIFRLLFLVSALFGGAGIAVYVIMWLIIPKGKSKGIVIDEATLEQGADEIREKAYKLKTDVDEFIGGSNPQKTLGIILLIFGSLVLLGNLGFLRFFDLVEFWPIIIIILGLLLIRKRE